MNGSEGVSKVIMIGGGTLVFLGVVGVVYTWGSVGTRWMWSAHVGVALSWLHWTRVETNGGMGTVSYRVETVGNIISLVSYLAQGGICRDLSST